MDIIAYLKPLIKWWWLLVAATLLAAITSFFATMRQPLIYQSKTTLMIGTTISEPNPNSSEFYLEQQLATIYADMGNREVVRNGAMQALGMSWLPAYSVRALPNTQLIEISVTDSVPVRAQAVANEIGHQLILQSPSSIQEENQSRANFINEQLVVIQEQIKESQDEIEKLNLQLGSLNSARQIADVQSQISGLETKVNTLQNTYASLAATGGRDATNSLSVIEPAALPTTPVGPGAMNVVILASMIGLTLSCLGVYIIEAIDDSVKSADEITHIFDIPILGSIPTLRDKDNRWDYIYKNPRSPTTDAFRMMRTNIDFLGVEKPIKSILITSPNVSEGKSTIASNLAFSFAQDEKRVILMDADFRRPVLHTAAQVSGEKGLSDVFLGSQEVDDVMTPWWDGRILLLPAGNLPPNPTELMGSKKMESIQKDLEKKADLVIIDAPPLILADSLILSKNVDGVLLVIRLGRTRKKSILAAKKQLEQAGTPLMGIVLNEASNGEDYYYKRYYSADAAREKAAVEPKNEPRQGQSILQKKPQKVDIGEIQNDPNPTPPFIEAEEDVETNFLGFPEFIEAKQEMVGGKPGARNT